MENPFNFFIEESSRETISVSLEPVTYLEFIRKMQASSISKYPCKWQNVWMEKKFKFKYKQEQQFHTAFSSFSVPNWDLFFLYQFPFW